MDNQIKNSVKKQDLPLKLRAYYQYLKILRKFYGIIPPFSFLGNLLALRGVDAALRYESVLKLVKGAALEIGSDDYSTLAQLHNDTLTTDIRLKPGIMLVASATNLPFKDDSFDTVVAVDVIEHLPKSLRNSAIQEMVRVAGSRVVISTPLENGHKFVGRKLDMDFDTWHKKKHGYGVAFTTEHLENGEPSPDELTSHGFEIMPYCNANLWLNYMRRQYRFRSQLWMPFLLFTAHLYYRLNASKDKEPPFWGGICVLDKKKVEIQRLNISC